MEKTVSLADWDTLTTAIRTFHKDAIIEEGEIRINVGAAHATISRDGAIDTGMPLHSFEHGSADPSNVTITVRDDSLQFEVDESQYVFRHP